MSNKSKLKKPVRELKLNLGAGQNPMDGFTSVDLYAPNPDIRCDLFYPPFRKVEIDECRTRIDPITGQTGPVILSKGGPLWKDNSVDEIHCSHFCEHIPKSKRWPFFEECWRILKPEGIMRIIVPSWKSERSLGDMTHEFPPVVSMFFFYLNKGWREANKLTYGPYDLKCNFDHQSGPTNIRGDFASKHHEAQVYAVTHLLETYDDAWITLTKRPL